MKYILLSVCLPLLMLTNAMSLEAGEPSPFKIMTFNLRYDASAGEASEDENSWVASSGEHRRELVFGVLADNDPDILCVQEGLKNQIQDLKGKLQAHSFYGVGRDDGKSEGEHCGIFFRTSRFESLDQGTFWLNEKADQPGTLFPETCCARIASWVILKDDANSDREFLLINMHWDHQIQAAREFAAQLVRKRSKLLAAGRPIVVVGDLNSAPDNPALAALLRANEENERVLIDSYREVHEEVEAGEGTYHGGFSGKTDGPRIDYVLHTDEFRAEDAAILHSHVGSRYPSDHFQVLASLRFTE